MCDLYISLEHLRNLVPHTSTLLTVPPLSISPLLSCHKKKTFCDNEDLKSQCTLMFFFSILSFNREK